MNKKMRGYCWVSFHYGEAICAGGFLDRSLSFYSYAIRYTLLRTPIRIRGSQRWLTINIFSSLSTTTTTERETAVHAAKNIHIATCLWSSPAAAAPPPKGPLNYFGNITLCGFSKGAVVLNALFELPSEYDGMANRKTQRHLRDDLNIYRTWDSYY